MIDWFLQWFYKPVKPGAGVYVVRRTGKKHICTFGCIIKYAEKRHILTCAHVFENTSKAPSVHSYTHKHRSGRTLGHAKSVSKGLDYALVRVKRNTRVHASFPKPIGKISPTVYPTDALNFVEPTKLKGRLEVQILGSNNAHPKKGLASAGLYAPFHYDIDKPTTYTIQSPYIEIKPALAKDRDLNFCTDGDSGALVVTDNSKSGTSPRPLGLLVAKAEKEDAIGAFGYAVPIQRILDDIGQNAHIETG